MNAIACLDESVGGWERSLYAFLAEKQRRSGSLRTVQSYSRMLNHFFGRASKTPDQVTSQDVFAWAYGTGLSGKPPGMHGIQGLGAGFVPEILDRSFIDKIIEVSDVAAERMARRLAREEGLLVGPSSGANVHAALETAQDLGSGNVVTILCDSGERYLF